MLQGSFWSQRQFRRIKQRMAVWTWIPVLTPLTNLRGFNMFSNIMKPTSQSVTVTATMISWSYWKGASTSRLKKCMFASNCLFHQFCLVCPHSCLVSSMPIWWGSCLPSPKGDMRAEKVSVYSVYRFALELRFIYLTSK